MKAIIEEGSSDIAAHMQDLALSEGALPIHLLRALFTASNDTRLLPLKYLSQQLLGLWSTGHPTTYGLLKRIFPLGLIAYLDSNEEPDQDFGEEVNWIIHRLFSRSLHLHRICKVSVWIVISL
jgi:DnaJ family protein C protein 13